MGNDTFVKALFGSLADDDLASLADRLSPYLMSGRPSNSRWLPSGDAASYLGIPYSSLKKLMAARAIPFEQRAPGCRCYFRTDELDAWRQRGGQLALA